MICYILKLQIIAKNNVMYKEIVKYWLDGQKKWNDYKDDVHLLFGQIWRFFVRKLVLKDENYLKPYNPLDNPDVIEKKQYRIHEEIEISENGWANIGLRLLLERCQNSFPKVQYLFTLSIKKGNDHWQVKFSNSSKVHSFRGVDKIENDTNDYSLIWNEFVELYKDQTINNSENWIDCNGRPMIGYLRNLSN